jgi:hypothetical protein
MIDAKQAVLLAKGKAEEILGPGPSFLEEIERESYKDHDVWSITLSFPRDLDKVSSLSRLSSLSSITSLYMDPLLQYKRFLIDVVTGELLAMKLREAAVQ